MRLSGMSSIGYGGFGFIDSAGLLPGPAECESERRCQQQRRRRRHHPEKKGDSERQSAVVKAADQQQRPDSQGSVHHQFFTTPRMCLCPPAPPPTARPSRTIRNFSRSTARSIRWPIWPRSAKAPRETSGQLAGPQHRFQTGLAQVQQYLSSTDFNNFTLQAAKPAPTVTSTGPRFP